ncbi:MAG TPA: hypothetical protein PLG34_13970, partial [Spirochaetota bacterium]|nr:hypothetical protein [Spirochaetota bacterium]
FEFKIQESGNLNLINNSVGWNDTKFWTLSGAGTVIADQDAEVRDNSNSKSGFKLNNITMSQTIDVIPNNQYSISAILKNVVSNSAYLKVINGTEEIIVFNDEIELDFVRYDNTFIANTNQITVQIYSSGDNLIVTDLVIASGDLIKTWFPGSNEIYTSNVKIDKDGISITNSVSGTKTVIDSSEFAIYAGSNKTIAVNKDLTTLRKTEILDTLTLGKLRFDKKTDGVDLTILD